MNLEKDICEYYGSTRTKEFDGIGCDKCNGLDKDCIAYRDIRKQESLMKLKRKQMYEDEELGMWY